MLSLVAAVSASSVSPGPTVASAASTNESIESSAGDPSRSVVPETSTGPPSTARSSSVPTTSARSAAVPPPTPSPTEAQTTRPEETAAATTERPAPEVVCRRVTDFAGADEQAGWRVTLDGVMGGRSSGQVSFTESTMLMTGEVVTAGGGFVLLRTPVFADAFTTGSFLRVRALSDGRGYEMVFTDDLPGRQRQLFHEATVPFTDSGDWQEVDVPLSGLSTTSNGRAVDAEPFDKDRAIEMGVIIKDGVDGPFRIELDWIDICST